MSTIPASLYVQVLPGVLAAGGTALVLNGVMLTNSTRLPIGTVASFPSADNVGAFFGLTSNEYAKARIYFQGFDNSTKKPTALLMAQYPSAAVSAWLKSAPISSIPLTTLQGLNQSLTILFDGVPRTAAINLAGATSYTAAAALIQASLNATQVSDSTFTGSVAPQTVSFVASISGNTMSVGTVTSGTLQPGAIVSGAVAGTQVTSQISGTIGGPGTYEVSVAQALTASALTASYGLLTVTAVASGTLSTGQTLFASSGVTAGTQITGYGTGTGLTGTYVVSPSQTVTSGTLQTIATPITATFDSVSGCLVLYSGDVGAVASSGFASGPLATSLGMTAATGAALSQGADGAQPGPFMSNLVNVTQNWCIFMHLFDPDGGNGNAQKLAFAQWNNAQNRRYLYVSKDTDPTPAASYSAPTSLGSLIGASNLAGTIPVWEPLSAPALGHAAFALSIPASTDFSARNGRATFAYKGQTGLTAGVTDLQTATNLMANGYNFYGASGTANQSFLFFYPGSASGPFLWCDSYVDEIWLNNALQQALMSLLTTAKSIPFNTEGYGLVTAACQDPIDAALYFGAIRSGITLSAQQKALINNAAGKVVDTTVTQQGYYLQVIDAAPQVRAQRGPLAVNLWYTDGQSVHTINLNSIAVL